MCWMTQQRTRHQARRGPSPLSPAPRRSACYFALLIKTTNSVARHARHHRNGTADRRACPFGTTRDHDRRLAAHGNRLRRPGGDTVHAALRDRTRVHRRTRRRATSNLIGKASLGRWTNGGRPASRAARHVSFRRRKAPCCPRV